MSFIVKYSNGIQNLMFQTDFHVGDISSLVSSGRLASLLVVRSGITLVNSLVSIYSFQGQLHCQS